MNKKLYYIIPLFLLEAMIQLGFFWLSPSTESRWVVYAFLTVTSITHLVITYVLLSGYGIRRAIPTVIAGSVAEMMIVVSSALLLAFKASLRSSLFLMFILTILYAALVATFALSIDRVVGESGDNGDRNDGIRYSGNGIPSPEAGNYNREQEKNRVTHNVNGYRNVNRGYVQNAGRPVIRTAPSYSSVRRTGVKTPPPVPTRP